MKATITRAIKRLLSALGSIVARLLGLVPKKYRVGASVILAVFAAYFIFSAGVQVAWTFTSNEVEFTVEGRDRVVRDGVSSYEVYTSAGIFTNQDSLLHLKRNSGDLQNMLRPGKTLTCKTQGFRFRYFHLMENLISCTEKMPGQVAAQ